MISSKPVKLLVIFVVYGINNMRHTNDQIFLESSPNKLGPGKFQNSNYISSFNETAS